MRRFGLVVGLWMGAAALGWAGAEPVGALAYEKALAQLRLGDQKAAEETIDLALRGEPENQRLLFFRAVCVRSRWGKTEAQRLFRRVQRLNPAAPEAECAALMIALDTGELLRVQPESGDVGLAITLDMEDEFAGNFAAMKKLQEAHPEDPLILWMAAVSCREIGLRGGAKFYSEAGVKYYEQLLKLLNPGPVLVHQTLANILTEKLGRHEEALEHRRIAIAQNPSAWTCQGMANTLTKLGRYAEADEYYKQSVRYAPDSAAYWSSWAWSLGARGDYQKAINVYQRVTRLDPFDSMPWRSLAWAAERLNRPDEAKRYQAMADSLEKRR